MGRKIQEGTNSGRRRAKGKREVVRQPKPCTMPRLQQIVHWANDGGGLRGLGSKVKTEGKEAPKEKYLKVCVQ